MSGSLIGFVVASIIRPPYPYFKFTVIHIGIGTWFSLLNKVAFSFIILLFYIDPIPYFNSGNIGNIPLVLIAALCRDPTNPFGDSDKCNEDGNAYISFGQWVHVFSFLKLHEFMLYSGPLLCKINVTG